MKPVHATAKHLPLYQSDSQRISLLFVSVSFCLGGLSGCLLAASVSGNGSAALLAYITEFLAAAQSGALEMPGLLSALWTVLRWPLAVVLLGCTAIGVVGIPLLFFLRGFLLSFCISAFVVALGSSGAVFAFLLLGVGSLITIPILFILGTQSLMLASQAKERGKKGRGKRAFQALNDPNHAIGTMFCLIALIFTILWEAYFVPIIVSGASKLFTA